MRASANAASKIASLADDEDFVRVVSGRPVALGDLSETAAQAELGQLAHLHRRRTHLQTHPAAT